MNPEDLLIETVATELNDLLSAARSGLEALDVDIQTTSPAGQDYTIWTGTFTKLWPGPTGFEQAWVRINLSCMLPIKPTEINNVEVSYHAMAEIFQTGKISRVRKISEGTFLLEQLRSAGMQNILLEKIEWGRNLLMSSEDWR